MNLFRLLPISSFAILLVCMVSSSATAQVNGAAVSPQGQIDDRESDNLFAIIGQVVRPGVYRAPLRNPFLIDLIHNAGGFSKKANGHLRIIRQTEQGATSFFATGRDFRLLKGDVVIAGRQFELTIAPQSDPRATVGGQATSQPVQLAFVNLANRPVVLKMRPEHATVGQILTLLGHSPTLAGSVKVYSSVDMPNQPPSNLQLITESVLVFDPNVMQASRLPALPMDIVNDTPRQNAAITPVHSEATTAPSRETRLPASGTQLPGQLGPVEQEHSPAVPPAHELDPPDLTTDVASNRIVDEPSDTLVQTASLPPQSTFPELPSDRNATNDPLAPPPVADAETSETSWLSTLMYWLLSIATFVGSSWGAMRVKQRRAQARSSESPIGSIVSGVRDVVGNRLSEIIYDRLPVVEEPVTQAKQTAGRSQSKPERTFRVDAAHEPRRPHYRPETAPPVEQTIPSEPAPPEPTVATASAESTTYRLSTPHEADVDRKPIVSVIRETENEPEGLLDRVLSRVHGATNR